MNSDTYSFTVRWSDVGVLNRLGRGNHSLGLRRLIDQARAQAAPGPAAVPPEPGADNPSTSEVLVGSREEGAKGS